MGEIKTVGSGNRVKPLTGKKSVAVKAPKKVKITPEELTFNQMALNIHKLSRSGWWSWGISPLLRPNIFFPFGDKIGDTKSGVLDNFLEDEFQFLHEDGRAPVIRHKKINDRFYGFSRTDTSPGYWSKTIGIGAYLYKEGRLSIGMGPTLKQELFMIGRPKTHLAPGFQFEIRFNLD